MARPLPVPRLYMEGLTVVNEPVTRRGHLRRKPVQHPRRDAPGVPHRVTSGGPQRQGPRLKLRRRPSGYRLAETVARRAAAGRDHPHDDQQSNQEKRPEPRSRPRLRDNVDVGHV